MKTKYKRRPRRTLKRKLKKRKGGSVVPSIIQDAFWTATDSVRDTYNALSGNYQAIDSSVTFQGKF
jgi:hypothetical protein